MDNILAWGVNVVLWLQQFSPALDLPFKALTFPGEEEFIMVFLPLLYWCFERRIGLRLAALTLLSIYANSIIKLWANQPRPFEVDSRVKQLGAEVSRGFPSGHTQNAVVMWGYLALQLRRRWMWILAAALMILTPLSRLYLGVHFPTDLLGGYLIGALLLWLFCRFEPQVESWLGRQSLLAQLALAVVAPIALTLLPLANNQDALTAAATVLGMGVGLALERRYIRFAVAGSLWQRAARFLLGMAIALALRFGLKAAFEGVEPESAFRVLRYTLIGLWVTLGAPWAFVRLRLSRTEKV
jgi:membrane-associated phospholipid phosphatase